MISVQASRSAPQPDVAEPGYVVTSAAIAAGITAALLVVVSAYKENA
ncbi:hypothetical protein [Lapillicoccus sp.]